MKALALVLVVASVPSAGIPSGLRGQDVERLPTRQRVVALTFDGGADARGARDVLMVLAAKDVTATFFLTGRFAERYPGLTRAIGARYRVGNHTATHRALTPLSRAEVEREVVTAQRSLARATGRDPRPLFRFPYGDRNATTIATVNRLGYVAVRWSVDSWGWMGRRGGMTPQRVVARVVSRLEPGAIVLLHLGAGREAQGLDTAALPSLIDAIRARGYRFVGLQVLGA